MNGSPEPVTWKTLAGFVLLAILVAAVAALIAGLMGAAWHPMVARIAGALYCAAIAKRLIALVGETAGVGRQAPADIALQPHIAKIEVDPLLRMLSGEIRRSRRLGIVTPALWERLMTLCGQYGVTGVDGQVRLHSWHELERVLQQLEDSA